MMALDWFQNMIICTFQDLSRFTVTGFIFRKERNFLEAAAAGASSSIKLVANIAANLIAFLAMLEFVNAVLSWFGSFVGFPEFSFQVHKWITVCRQTQLTVLSLKGLSFIGLEYHYMNVLDLIW